MVMQQRTTHTRPHNGPHALLRERLDPPDKKSGGRANFGVTVEIGWAGSP
jgi:hypothetical protein